MSRLRHRISNPVSIHPFEMWSARERTFFSSFAVVIFYTVTSVTENENLELLQKVVESCDRLVTFFKDYSNQANLDGIFGVHVAGEQLCALLEEIDKRCPEDLPNLNFTVDSIRKLQYKLTMVADKAIPFIARAYTKYYDNVGFSLRKNLWKTLKPSRKTNSSLLYTSFSNESLAESKSDDCFHEIEDKKCIPSKHCWNYMTPLNKTGYYTTHSLLFIQVGQALGCKKFFNQLSDVYYGLTIDQLSQIYCSNVLSDSQNIAERNFTTDKRDLLMEQIGLCGMDGFYEFFQPEWIKAILAWQKPSGCFGRTRRKREEWQMSDGCLSHKSTVALLALQQSITHLLKPMLKTSCPGLN